MSPRKADPTKPTRRRAKPDPNVEPPKPTPDPEPSPEPEPTPELKPAPKPAAVSPMKGQPSGTIPRGPIGGGGPWSLVSKWAEDFNREGLKHQVDPAWLESMMIVESGGKEDARGAGGAFGPMQFKEHWRERLEDAGYDIDSTPGQIGGAAAMLGGNLPGVRGNDVRERFLYTYYPILNDDGSIAWDRTGESGHTPRMYVDAIEFYSKLIRGAGDGDGTPVELNFGPHPLPQGFEIRIATKRANSSGSGWNYVQSPRGPRLRVVFWHHTAGGPGFTKDSCWELFSIGGEREYQALTEAVVDRDGTGYVLNDPWSEDPMDGSHRSPFASGPYVKNSPVLAPFVRQFGANAINELGWATEHCHAEGETWGDRILDGSAKLHGWVITMQRIPYDQFPKNPNMGGLWASFDHDDAASTTCPNIPAGVRQALVEATRAEAKKLQVSGSISPPPPPPDPDEPAPWPFAFSELEMAEFWKAEGGLTRYWPKGGTPTQYQFDKNGPISAMWLARGKSQGVFPAALEWWQDLSGWNFISFGTKRDVDWVLGIPTLDGRADWRWVDSRQEVTE